MQNLLIKNLKISDFRLKNFIDRVKLEADEEVVQWYSRTHRFDSYDCISCWLVDDCVISASFCRPYGDWYRIGQMHYTLKQYRKTHPSAMLRKDGFLDHHIHDNQDLYKGVFFSIHTYNKRMRIQSEMMHKRLINTYGEELTSARNRIVFCGNHKLHGADQDIFVIPYGDFDKEKFIESVC